MSRVVVIEDSPAIALLLRRRLEMANHEVDVFAGGLHALELFDPTRLPDVVLTDVMMSGIDGFETMRRIKSRYPFLPVVLVTGQHLVPGQGSEADAVIGKPIDFELLLETVDRLTGAGPLTTGTEDPRF